MLRFEGFSVATVHWHKHKLDTDPNAIGLGVDVDDSLLTSASNNEH